MDARVPLPSSLSDRLAGPGSLWTVRTDLGNRRSRSEGLRSRCLAGCGFWGLFSVFKSLVTFRVPEKRACVRAAWRRAWLRVHRVDDVCAIVSRRYPRSRPSFVLRAKKRKWQTTDRMEKAITRESALNLSVSFGIKKKRTI